MTAGDKVAADLAALKAPGGAHPTTIPGTVRPPVTAAPKGWEAGFKVAPDGAMMVTTPPQRIDVQRDEGAWQSMVEELGLEVPPGWRVRLVEAKYDPAAWHRDEMFVDDLSGESETGKTKAPAVTRPVWRYRFAVERDEGRVHDDDVAAMIRDAMRTKRKRPKPVVAARRSLNVVYADPQAGKVAVLGGTNELVARFRDCIDMLDDHIRDIRKIGRGATEAAWLDGGDCIEGFENVKSQAQTNDMTLTQQVRAHRRLTYEGLDHLAGKFSDVTAATCGSNHARVRKGKDPVAGPDDDWGIEILSQVQDGYVRNPDAYGHVKFAYPPAFKDSLSLDLGGLPVGLAHGHQVNKPEAIHTWWKGQAFGNQPATYARVLVTGHFHHFASKEVGDGRLWVQAPTLDNGSDWYTQRSGESSVPGLLVFSTTEDGWDDLRILRPGGSESLRRDDE